jgi:hypothetical protein
LYRNSVASATAAIVGDSATGFGGGGCSGLKASLNQWGKLWLPSFVLKALVLLEIKPVRSLRLSISAMLADEASRDSSVPGTKPPMCTGCRKDLLGDTASLLSPAAPPRVAEVT